MPYSTAGKNLMLNALSAAVSHASLFQEGTALTGITSVAATDLITKASHGFSSGDIVVFRTLSGGTGLKEDYPYFVIATGLTANDFKVSTTSGGSSFDHTTNLTSGSVIKLTELTGGSPAYARKAIAFATGAEGLIDDSTNGAVFDVAAGTTVNYCGFNSALTVGTLYAAKKLTPEVFAGQGTYTLTDAKLDLNNDVLP